MKMRWSTGSRLAPLLEYRELCSTGECRNLHAGRNPLAPVLARLAGMSRAARRVAQAMRRAPRGRNLPWHRVVNAQGRISLPAESAGYQRQKRRLEEEGVVFVKGSIKDIADLSREIGILK